MAQQEPEQQQKNTLKPDYFPQHNLDSKRICRLKEMSLWNGPFMRLKERDLAVLYVKVQKADKRNYSDK